ncbi:MAG: hypothetical protein LBD85_02775 [Oscillospiraceae bacterium]|jgi:hypothetical protein|nr:hypothetical protein [Oscillospiraceae bacterium]
MNEENFDLGLELANLLTRSSGNAGGGSGASGGSVGTPRQSDERNFETLLTALAPYLSGTQIQRLNKALELAELLRSARRILPGIGGAAGM